MPVMHGHYSNCPINTLEFKLHVKKTKVCDRQIAPTNINFFISEHALSIFLAGKCRPQCRETFAWKFRCVSAWPFLASIGSFWCHNSPLEVFRTIATLPSDHIHDSPTMGIERNAMSTESCTCAYLNYPDLFKHICSHPRLVVYFKGLLELSILEIKWHIQSRWKWRPVSPHQVLSLRSSGLLWSGLASKALVFFFTSLCLLLWDY